MQIWGNGSSPTQLGGGLRIRALGTRTSSGGSGAGSGLSLRGFAADVRELGDALKSLRLGGRFRTSGSDRDAIFYSRSDLELGSDPTAATIRSTEEVNTTPTSYSTTAPTWQGTSDAAPSVGGTYDGSQGDDTLTFTASLGGVVGTSPIQIDVTDSSGGAVDSFTIGIGAGGDTFTLSNGLELEFDSGTIQLGDTFELDVFSTVGTSVTSPTTRGARASPASSRKHQPRLRSSSQIGLPLTAGTHWRSNAIGRGAPRPKG